MTTANGWANTGFIINGLEKTRDKAQEAINRVRMLHLPKFPSGTPNNPCNKCAEIYPCTTINALKGAPFGNS